MAVSLMLGVVLLGLLLSFTVLFPINEFQVEGEMPYTNEEIIAAFGPNEGANIFRFKIAEEEERIETLLPYIETVHIRRRLPGTVVFEVTQAVETYVVNTGVSNLILSQNMKILRAEEVPPEGLCQITGLQVSSKSTVGSPLLCEETSQQEQLHTVMQALKEWFPEGVTAIDIANPLEMSFTYQNRLVVKLGANTRLDYKLEMACTVIQEKITVDESGTVDASYIGKVFFKAHDLGSTNTEEGSYTEQPAEEIPQTPAEPENTPLEEP